MFFYVNDVVFAFRKDKKKMIEALIIRLKAIFEFRDLGDIKYFLGVRVLIKDEISAIESSERVVYLIQDAYIDKLIKEYDLSVLPNAKLPRTPLSIDQLAKYEGDVDPARLIEYRQKVGFICYPIIITRPDIAKSASKLIEFLINLDPEHLLTANHCIRYLYAIKYLAIRYSTSESDELTIKTSNTDDVLSAKTSKDDVLSRNVLSRRQNLEDIYIPDASDSKRVLEKHVFETTMNASFANENDRRSAEDYTFKLFDDLIDWAARKQFIVSTFIIEAELLSLLHGAKEFIW